MLNNWNIRFWEYEFFSPHWLWLMCALPVLLIIPYLLEKTRKGDLKFSRPSKDQTSIGSSWIFWLRQGFILSNVAIAACIIFALAKPFHWNQHDDFDKEYKDGIDIILAMDVSLSMLAMDFSPNRLEAAKTLKKFNAEIAPQTKVTYTRSCIIWEK